ncbi:hypothetical protein BJ508DRAFT_237462 [Ascobolus immersus RN42]|uniref:Uncharacterized protein n=1 Tax=Ascobolus immersus RN42 TaxID=1160509 RepID=A0A3N4IC38_ASCIM|nr:hypothetical protein BJ508DRAFT_237462 [Ascobolus immersus RN42]
MSRYDNYGNRYQVVSRGVNEKGNRWVKTDFGAGHPNENTYRYSNGDGGFYYNNPSGSRYWSNDAGTDYFWPADCNDAKWIREGGSSGQWRLLDPDYGASTSNISGRSQQSAASHAPVAKAEFDAVRSDTRYYSDSGEGDDNHKDRNTCQHHNQEQEHCSSIGYIRAEPLSSNYDRYYACHTSRHRGSEADTRQGYRQTEFKAVPNNGFGHGQQNSEYHVHGSHDHQYNYGGPNVQVYNYNCSEARAGRDVAPGYLPSTIHVDTEGDKGDSRGIPEVDQSSSDEDYEEESGSVYDYYASGDAEDDDVGGYEDDGCDDAYGGYDDYYDEGDYAYDYDDDGY